MRTIHLSLLLAIMAAPAAAQTPFNDQVLGKRFHITAESLPEPFASDSVGNGSRIVERDGAVPQAPEGFSITLFAEGLAHPRQMQLLPNGAVLLAQQRTGEITYLMDEDGDGSAEIVKRFTSGFSGPYGMALVPRGEYEGDILVADVYAIWRIPYDGGEAPVGDWVRVTDRDVFGVPRGHNTRSLLVDPQNGEMYVGVGSMTNISEEPEGKAAIHIFDADGTGQRIFASGMRNPIGMNFHPETGVLWAVNQERDGMGNELVPDYLTSVEEGDFFGWPYAYTGGFPQPNFQAPEGLIERTKLPDVLFEAHSSSMDFVFVPDSWPEDYRGDVIAALKGSWNRADPGGYKLVRVFFENGQPTGEYENFVNNFWVAGTDTAGVWGRPANLELLDDGSILIADDTGGTIWKLTPPAN